MYYPGNLRGCKSSLPCRIKPVLSQSYRFRWIVCQLEALRRCFPSAIRRTLEELPMSLDETYDRILLGIARERQKYAHRLLQCLAVSIRPLHVEELADILAIQFDEGALPSYDANWRVDNPEEAVLSACSSLVAIVAVHGERIVQFSHFSVQEYLTSKRLADAGEHLSQYHILPRSAHTTIAQASLSVLLALDDQMDKTRIKNFPFAIYAGRYWVEHARFDNVSSSIEEAMEHLFDPSRPQFATWVWIYDIDSPFREIMFATNPTLPEAVSLYYATLCGFCEVLEYLIVTRPQDVNARGGYHGTPLHAAVSEGKLDVVTLLFEHGADVNALDDQGRTPIFWAWRRGHLDMVELLLINHADVNARDAHKGTLLFHTSLEGDLEATRLLLRHGALLDVYDENGSTPIMEAAQNGHLGVVSLMLQNCASGDSLENGAVVNSRDNDGWTPLVIASQHGHPDVVRLLLESRATVDARNNYGSTPLAIASDNGHSDVVRLLLERCAAVDSRDNDGRTPLAIASRCGHLDVVRVLLESGAAVDSRNNDGWTPLAIASSLGHLDIVRILLENGAPASVGYSNNDGCAPPISGFQDRHSGLVHLLLQNGTS
jgi:ankyrin repeat protein